jgi:peroxiredoxin
LRSFEQHLPDFAARNTRVIAISVDSNEESRTLSQSQGYTFPILSDPRAETIRAYGVIHQGGAGEGHDIARPAEFLIDQSGTIRWANLAETLVVRLRPETVLRAIDAMAAAGSR